MISLLSTTQDIKQTEIGGNTMRFPMLEDVAQTQTRPLLFQGLNKKEMIEDNEIADGINLDTELLPAISPRKPMKLERTLAAPASFTIINGKQVYVDGTDFYYDGLVKGTVTAGLKTLLDFNGNVLIFPDKKYYDYIGETFGTFTAPDIDYATIHYNRVFGIKGSDIRASKVGDFKTWEDFSGTALDSWAADVYSPGDFTGITSYQDHVVFFKRDQMYELYGYIPSQFKIVESAKVGCIDNRSIAEIGGVLYFLSEAGVMTYSGGFPRAISDKLNATYTSGAAIGDGRKYYLNLNGEETFIFDTLMNTWMPYSKGNIIQFARFDNDIYPLDSLGNLNLLGEGLEPLEWEVITKDFDDGTFRKKSIKAIRLKVNLDLGSELEVYVKLDGRSWVLHKTIKQVDKFYTNKREIVTTIPLKRASNYQIKIVGRGKAIVYGEREFIVGSDK